MYNSFKAPISKRFIDAYPQFKRTDPDDTTNYFWESWQMSPFYNANFTEDDLLHIYDHLCAEYYNWHFIYMDDYGINMNVFHLIEEYYPNTKTRLELAKDLRELSLKEFKKSGININSQGNNPKLKKDMDELIDQIDSQNASFQLKSLEQTIRAKFFALVDGVMTEFIDRFKPLFVKLYSGVNNYIYFNEEEDEG